MGLYLRAVAYFRKDRGLVLLWLTLIGLSTALGLLSAWPMAILIDSGYNSLYLIAGCLKDDRHLLRLSTRRKFGLGQI